MCMAHPYPPCGATPPITSFKSHGEVISTLPQIVMAHPVSSQPGEASAAQSNPEEGSFNPNPEVSRPRKDRRLLSYSQPSSPGLFAWPSHPDQFWSSNHGEFLYRKPYETLLQQLPSKNSRKMCSSFNDISISNRKACEDDFVETLVDVYKCPICLEVLDHPYQTECGHRFCHTCITTWIRDSGGRCPNCKEFVSPSKIYPDNFARREVESLRIRCPNRRKGCNVVCSLKELNEHLARECFVSSITARCLPKTAKQQVNKNKLSKNTEFVDWLDKVVDDFLEKSSPPTTPLQPSIELVTDQTTGRKHFKTSSAQTEPFSPTTLDRGLWLSEFEILPEESNTAILKDRKRYEFEKYHSTNVYEIPNSFCSKNRFYQTSVHQPSPLTISSEMSLISRCSAIQVTDGDAKMCF